MPTYCYSNEETGEVVERDFSMGEATDTIVIDGVTFARDYQAELGGTPASTGSGWPMEPCVASGVNAADAQNLRDHLAKAGVPTEVTKNGDPVYRDPNHRKKALEARGLHDNNSYY